MSLTTKREPANSRQKHNVTGKLERERGWSDENLSGILSCGGGTEQGFEKRKRILMHKEGTNLSSKGSSSGSITVLGPHNHCGWREDGG